MGKFYDLVWTYVRVNKCMFCGKKDARVNSWVYNNYRTDSKYVFEFHWECLHNTAQQLEIDKCLTSRGTPLNGKVVKFADMGFCYYDCFVYFGNANQAEKTTEEELEYFKIYFSDAKNCLKAYYHSSKKSRYEISQIIDKECKTV